MADSIIEQIKKGKSLVSKLQKTIADMEADGVDADEAKRIEQNKAQIKQLMAELNRLEQQFEADKNEWNGLSGDLETVRDRLKTLKDWGSFDLAAIESELSVAEGFAKSEDYRDAITRLGEIKTALANPYAEYTKQSEAKKKYDTDLQSIEARLAEAKNSTFQTDAVSKGIAQVERNLPAVAKEADAKDYVAANGLLDSTASELGLVEKEIAKAMEEDSAVRQEYEPLQATAAAADAVTFAELADRIATAKTGTEQVGSMIDTFEFTSARSQIATLSHEFDLINAEAEKLEAAKKAEEEEKKRLKEEWERNANRYQELQKKVGELETWGSSEAANLRALVTEIDSFVAAEEYQFAIDGLASAESAVSEPYSNYLAQQEAQKTYDASRPPLDTRAQTARGNKYADGVVGTMLNDLDGDLGWMDGMAKDKDFVQANTRIAGAGTQLDKIERDLRDLETTAKVAEEMGDVSSPEAEREIKRRLYVQEQPLARDRVDAAVEADVLDESTAAQLEQLESSLEGAEAQADAENYAEALDAVRTIIDEMPFVEETIRKQTEQKKLFEDALAAVKAEIATFNDSAHRRVREDAATLENSLADGVSLAEARDYEQARVEADLWLKEVDRIRKEESDIAKDHAAADAALIEIQSRLDKALANESVELQPGLEGLKVQKAEVDNNYTDEDYAAAVTSIGNLKELLVEFEEEAEKQEQKDLYDAAVESLKLEQRLADAVALAYPEAEEQLNAADAGDKDRKSLAEQEKYEEARDKAFDEGKALDGFDTRKDEIELAKEQYELNLPTLQQLIDAALAPFDQNSDELVKAQGELKDLKQQLDQALAQKRYIEALRLGEETKTKADEVNKLRFELTPINEAKTIEWITGCVKIAAIAFGAGANSAVTNFRIDVLDSVTSERGEQTFSKWTGYVMDVAAAVGWFSPAGPTVQYITTGIKTVVAIGADDSDSADDDAERAAANELISQLATQAGEVVASFNKDFGSTMKSQSKDKFEEIGRFFARDEFPQARTALKGCGVPMDATPPETESVFLGQLRAKFAASKR
jgi:hypothetical protein